MITDLSLGILGHFFWNSESLIDGQKHLKLVTVNTAEEMTTVISRFNQPSLANRLRLKLHVLVDEQCRGTKEAIMFLYRSVEHFSPKEKCEMRILFCHITPVWLLSLHTHLFKSFQTVFSVLTLQVERLWGRGLTVILCNTGCRLQLPESS